MFDRLGILIGFSIVGILGAGIFVADALNLGTPNTFEAALAQVKNCVQTEEKDFFECSRPAAEKMLDFKSATEVMDELSTTLTLQQCHFIGHIIGRQSFIRNQNIEDTISSCTRTCESACVHGAIGQAFAQELGLEDTGDTQRFDLKHMSLDDVLNIGRQLCASPEACHGIGHVLFQIYGKFEPGLAMCRKIAEGSHRGYCYHGVYMEYADILSSREIRTTPGVTYPSPETLDSLCSSQPTFWEKMSCFPYFPRMVGATLQEGGISSDQAARRVREICDSYLEKDNRAACFFGIGVSSSYSLMKDAQSATQICQEFPKLLDQTACNLGQVSASTRDRLPNVVAYCAALPDSSLRPSCYQAVFYYLNRSGAPMQDVMKLCKGDSVCERESKNYESIPLQWILEGFET